MLALLALLAAITALFVVGHILEARHDARINVKRENLAAQRRAFARSRRSRFALGRHGYVPRAIPMDNASQRD